MLFQTDKHRPYILTCVHLDFFVLLILIHIHILLNMSVFYHHALWAAVQILYHISHIPTSWNISGYDVPNGVGVPLIPDSQSDYPFCRHFCGVQIQIAQASDRDAFP